MRRRKHAPRTAPPLRCTSHGRRGICVCMQLKGLRWSGHAISLRCCHPPARTASRAAVPPLAGDLRVRLQLLVGGVDPAHQAAGAAGARPRLAALGAKYSAGADARAGSPGGAVRWFPWSSGEHQHRSMSSREQIPGEQASAWVASPWKELSGARARPRRLATYLTSAACESCRRWAALLAGEAVSPAEPQPAHSPTRSHVERSVGRPRPLSEGVVTLRVRGRLRLPTGDRRNNIGSISYQ